jgi:hypothetical protein
MKTRKGIKKIDHFKGSCKKIRNQKLSPIVELFYLDLRFDTFKTIDDLEF